MWIDRAKAVTPCASQTLSKRPAAFVEGVFPTHVSGGQGAYLFAAESGECYLDFMCGLAAVGLGYTNKAVTRAVTDQLMDGVSFSLPHTLEVEVAEMLVARIPCAEQVRFVKTGSEACAGAVRIARQVTGKHMVITLGYHGWHDWYAATKDFRPGIEDALTYLVNSVEYNNIDDLEYRLDANYGEGGTACVILEPTLIDAPHEQYLQNVVDLAHRAGALVVFDEMVTGFRWALAGGQAYFNVMPDLATFGKAMANGFPLACVVGSKEYMQHAWTISGTFGGEAMSLAACKATLLEYDRLDAVSTMWQRGIQLTDGIRALLCELDLDKLFGCDGYPVHPRVFVKPSYPDDERFIMSLLMQDLCDHLVLIHPAGFNISAAMSKIDIDFALVQFKHAFSMVGDAVYNKSFDQFHRDLLRGEPYQPAPLRTWIK